MASIIHESPEPYKNNFQFSKDFVLTNSEPLLQKFPARFVDDLRRHAEPVSRSWAESPRDPEVWRFWWRQCPADIRAELRALQRACILGLTPLMVTAAEADEFLAAVGVPAAAALHVMEVVSTPRWWQGYAVAVVDGVRGLGKADAVWLLPAEIRMELENVPMPLAALFDVLRAGKDSLSLRKSFLRAMVNQTRLRLEKRGETVWVQPPPPAPEVAIARLVSASPQPLRIDTLRECLAESDGLVGLLGGECSIPGAALQPAAPGTAGLRVREPGADTAYGSPTSQHPLNYVTPALRMALYRRRDLGVLPFGPQTLGALHHLPEMLTPVRRQAICDQLAACVLKSTHLQSRPRLRQLLHFLSRTSQELLDNNPYLLEAVLLWDQQNRFRPGQTKDHVVFLRPGAAVAAFQGLADVSETDAEDDAENDAEGDRRACAAPEGGCPPPPNPYREKTPSAWVYDLLSQRAMTYEEVERRLAVLGFPSGRVRSAFYVVTSPTREGHRADPRGHFSAKGHLYYAEKDSQKRIRLYGRAMPLPEKRRGRRSSG